MFNHLIITILLFIVFLNFGLFNLSYQAMMAFGYKQKNMIDKSYSLSFETSQIKNNHLFASLHGENRLVFVPLSLQPNSHKTNGLNSSSPLYENQNISLKELPVPAGSNPHDVAPSVSMLHGSSSISKIIPKDTVWYTAQASGELGRLNTTTGKT